MSSTRLDSCYSSCSCIAPRKKHSFICLLSQCLSVNVQALRVSRHTVQSFPRQLISPLISGRPNKVTASTRRTKRSAFAFETLDTGELADMSLAINSKRLLWRG